MKERLVLSKSGLGGIERGSRGGEMGEGAAERLLCRLDVDQSKVERNHSLTESAQHDFMFSGASAKGRVRQ